MVDERIAGQDVTKRIDLSCSNNKINHLNTPLRMKSHVVFVNGWRLYGHTVKELLNEATNLQVCREA